MIIFVSQTESSIKFFFFCTKNVLESNYGAQKLLIKTCFSIKTRYFLTQFSFTHAQNPQIFNSDTKEMNFSFLIYL